ncbi:phosphatidylinositol-3-phosphatase [Entomortierella parvispora]|uniref:Phosphatidylinositol-3-phosphatase n=1 Tax=Entomortierella parvispora TaxID=205924 RepID=A0A9P3HH26_9FUNG|nr:phosphatidylinositol-3-phosphatase [Entomortierella parvispora]
MLLKTLASFAVLASAALAAPPKGAAYDHVFVIFLENTDYSLAYSDSNFQALLSQGVLLDNYHGLTHPSQPNYIAAIAGDYFDVSSDSSTEFDSTYKTVVDLIEAKQLTWKGYMEDIPSACYTGTSSKSLYYRKHDPFVSFDLISKNMTRCISHVVPATQLQTDLNNGSLPNYSFYTPNIKNDGHDTTVAYASQWLTGFLTPLLSNPNFLKNTLVVVTFDEADDYSDETNHILTLLLGDAVSSLKGTTDDTYYTHYSLISTVTNNWGLGNLGRNDVGQLANVFSFVANATGYQNVAVPNPPPLNG